MASAAPTTPDTLVTLKVNLDGTTRRFKLPLRDLGASTLEHKLRGLLAIPKETDALFERYSDSAGCYVVLDTGNVSIYKQLYRAAKAKQKLKLRLTTKKVFEQDKAIPMPVYVEDDVEPETSQPALEEQQKSSAPTLPDVPVQPPITLECRPRPTISAAGAEQLRQSLACMEREHLHMERNLEMIGLSVAALKKPFGPIPDVAAPLTWTSPPPTLETRRQTLPSFGLAQEAEVKGESTSPAVAESSTTEVPLPHPRINFAVVCNSCDRNIPVAHYHCSTCDDGDFDLCQDCVDQGITCYGVDHWLIKRFVKSGVIINSTTERIAPKPKVKSEPKLEVTPKIEPVQSVQEGRSVPTSIPHVLNDLLYANIRTCNSCVKELPEADFVHCTSCDDFDLCKSCFGKNEHGHHPKHGFVPVIDGSKMPCGVMVRLAPGRAQYHNAVCDGCDEAVVGVRHKCLDCPDWDYCSNCVENAAVVHPNHRFVPIYEPLEDVKDMRARTFSRPSHYGICCDGPLCTSASKKGPISYISGDRYKCAVCHDTDFCASCEASPANTHNRTHPLIKFKTPVRGVTVSTTGEHSNGQPMPVLGDRQRSRPSSTSSRATETSSPAKNLSTNLLTVVDVAPTEPVQPIKSEEPEPKKTEQTLEKSAPVEKPLTEKDLVAEFQGDSIVDGTIFAPNTVFEQTWVLRNEGEVAWPAGCSIKFVSGDYMGHLDPDHPAAIGELVSSSESTICYAPVAPGQEVNFTVLLRSPAREGRYISNWRLTTNDGLRFGHRLWCDIAVERQMTPKPVETPKAESVVEAKTEESSVKSEQSQMIFPRLEKESPVNSVYMDEVAAHKDNEEDEEFEDCAEDDEWAEDNSEDGFLTDEEYDILDASDEEYLDGQQKLLRK